MFKRATRKNAKLRLALSGTAGAGKTYSALLIAKEFGQKIAVLDSERGSASLYAELVPFDVCELDERNPQTYIETLHAAASAGYDVVVIDSYSHSWIGALEIVDKMGGSKFSNGWKVVSPLVQKLVDTILAYPGHVIATMRSKADYAVEVQNGRAVPKKLGMATVARDGTDYEFSVLLDLTVDGGVSVAKSRCSALAGGVFTREDIPKIAQRLKAWLSEGAALSPRDAIAERIRFAASDAELGALLPEIKALSADERKALQPIFTARKEELSA
jgi:hypothetical protein